VNPEASKVTVAAEAAIDTMAEAVKSSLPAKRRVVRGNFMKSILVDVA
jgi:hypothetical protein